MPVSAQSLKVNPMDPLENCSGLAQHLALQYKQFKSCSLALTPCNAGPEAIQRYGGISPHAETKSMSDQF